MSELEISTHFQTSIKIKEVDTQYGKHQAENSQWDGEQLEHEADCWHGLKLFRSLLHTDAILICFTSLFYGLVPCGFRKHESKCKHSSLTIALTVLHWFCFASYVYFVSVFWSGTRYGTAMPLETKAILIGLLASAACTYSLATAYFYSKVNNFTRGGTRNRSFSIFPVFEFRLPGQSSEKLNVGPTGSDWFYANVFLFFGFFCCSFVIFIDFHYNAFFDYTNNHGFLGALSPVGKLHYHLSVATGFFGFYATVCAVCIYHIITRDLIRHIEETESYILNDAKDRADFQEAHRALQIYGRKLLLSFKWWFNVHTMFFVFLVLAMIFEWIKMLDKTEQKTARFGKLLLSQIAGSMFIAFKFSFPFLSASQVTTRYSVFYYRIARYCRIENLPELSLLHSSMGIKLFGFRITSNFAVTTIFLSFLGAIKLLSFSQF